MERHCTIRVENLVTGYTDKHRTITVTPRFDASLCSGELTCLLGPNGAGKSTLLKTLSGFLPPVSGTIEIEGRRVNDYSESRLARMIGVVLTERISLNNMTVEELVAMGRSPYTGFWGRLSADDRRIVDESISLVRIDDLRKRMIQTLSDGERQKTMIAKALAQETPVIFLDEPTAFLDFPSKVEVMQLLLNLARMKNKTVFLSTHDLELALQIADKIWLIDKAKGVEVGTPEDLSLSGRMGEFFAREGVVFDRLSGMFRIDSHPSHRIRVNGTGMRANMVRKACLRRGYLACDDADVEFEVEVGESDFRLAGRSCASIGELLQAIEDFALVGDK